MYGINAGIVIACFNHKFVSTLAKHTNYWDLKSKKRARKVENSGLKICITYLKQSTLDKQTVGLYDATVLKESKGVDNSTKATICYTHEQTTVMALNAVNMHFQKSSLVTNPALLERL